MRMEGGRHGVLTWTERERQRDSRSRSALLCSVRLVLRTIYVLLVIGDQ